MERLNDKVNISQKYNISRYKMRFHIITILFLGILMGILYFYFFRNRIDNIIKPILKNMLNIMQTTKIDYEKYCVYVFNRRGIQCLVFVFALMDNNYKIILKFVMLYLGFSIGMLFCILVYYFDLRGILLGIAEIVPHYILYFFAYKGLEVVSEERDKIYYHKGIKIISSVFYYIAGILCEVFIAPIIMNRLSLLF